MRQEKMGKETERKGMKRAHMELKKGQAKSGAGLQFPSWFTTSGDLLSQINIKREPVFVCWTYGLPAHRTKRVNPCIALSWLQKKGKLSNLWTTPLPIPITKVKLKQTHKYKHKKYSNAYTHTLMLDFSLSCQQQVLRQLRTTQGNQQIQEVHRCDTIKE